MIIIPEKEIVLITPPRTGSTTLRAAIREAYPAAWMPYRHMEASGVPYGYDRWRRIGVFRDPLERLSSLYHYCRGLYKTDRGTQAWRNKMYLSTLAGFEAWLLNNELTFTDPFDSDGSKFYPNYAVHCPIPENRKSLFHYIRPDLGTEIWALENVLTYLALDGGKTLNASNKEEIKWTDLSHAAQVHMKTFHSWDLGTSIINAQE